MGLPHNRRWTVFREPAVFADSLDSAFDSRSRGSGEFLGCREEPDPRMGVERKRDSEMFSPTGWVEAVRANTEGDVVVIGGE